MGEIGSSRFALQVAGCVKDVRRFKDRVKSDETCVQATASRFDFTPEFSGPRHPYRKSGSA